MKNFTRSTIKRQKQISLPVVASMDFLREWHEGEIKSPFYSICKDGRWLSVKYYGICEVNRSLSLEEAKQFVQNQLDRYAQNLQED